MSAIAELRSRYKSRLQSGQASIDQAFSADQDTPALLRARSQLVDEVLAGLWQSLEMPPALALLATGGYGRGELWPSSDIDILILLSEKPDETLTATLEQLVTLFWDIGLEIAHSVRTPEECLRDALEDLTMQTALVESRRLCGNESLFNDFIVDFRAQIDPQAFYRGKRLEQEERYRRYHESPYSLEPNCKESPGGLRDLQTILWISQAAGYGNSWKDLEQRGFIIPAEAHGLERRERFLQTLRVHLHHHARRHEDRLLFDYQTVIAEKLGYTDTPTRRASEQLMQEYYRVAKAITQLNTVLLQNLGAAIYPAPAEQVPQAINERFQKTRQLLDVVHEEVFNETPGAILETFLLMQQHPELLGLSARTIRALWRARTLIDDDFRNDPQNKANFIAIFQQERGIIHEVRRMNQFEILGRYLPEFGKIVGQMQHDLFHAYTVDQHTLLVLRNLRRFCASEFAHEYPLCSQLIGDFDQPWLIYLTAIFHDIAKGRGGGHAERGALDAHHFCGQHGLSPEETELIVWLVRHHLLMSGVSQKKDISDPDVVSAFAEVVKDERHLTALYLLTVADIRGTSPKVWNAWKGQLLEDLYLHTLRQLQAGGKAPARQGLIQEKQQEAERLMACLQLPPHAHAALWKRLDTVYFLRHSAEEIAWHSAALLRFVDADRPVVRARLSPHGDGIEVMAYTRDVRELFARMVGFFSRAGFNILDAKIHTTRHGYALDSFMLHDVRNRDDMNDLIQFIECELADRLTREATPEAPVGVRPSRQIKHFPFQPVVSIEADDKGRCYVLSVSAADRPGLLYTVAMTLAEHGISLQTAKIATLGERVEDTFLISGGDLHDTASRIRLESELLERLKN